MTIDVVPILTMLSVIIGVSIGEVFYFQRGKEPVAPTVIAILSSFFVLLFLIIVTGLLFGDVVVSTSQ